jgi:hypothetical protein
MYTQAPVESVQIDSFFFLLLFPAFRQDSNRNIDTFFFAWIFYEIDKCIIFKIVRDETLNLLFLYNKNTKWDVTV